MVLVSVGSTENNNGYDWNNDFAEALVIEPNAKISLVNVLFSRTENYVVVGAGNAFEVVIGNLNNAKETVAVLPGTYTPYELASTIQSALNEKGNRRGHSFNVNYDHKEQQFSVSSLYHLGALPSIEPNFVEGTDNPTGAELGAHIVFNEAANTLDYSKSDDGTNVDTVNTFSTSWSLTKGLIETNDIPDNSDGGSFFQASIDGPLTVPTNNDNRSVVIGLYSGELQPYIATGATDISTEAVYKSIDNCIILTTAVGGAQTLKIIENGQDIGFQKAPGEPYLYTPSANEKFKIQYNNDNEFPEYFYRKVNQGWSKLPVGGGGNGGNQSLKIVDIKRRLMHGLLGANNGVFGGFNNLKITPRYSRALVGQDLETNDLEAHSLEQEATGGTYALSRTLNANIDTNDKGYLSQQLEANEYSELDFVVPSSGIWFLSVVDKTQADLNKATGTDLGTVDPRVSIQATGGNNGNGAQAAAANGLFNPALVTLRFDRANNSIETRREMNTQYNGTNELDLFEDITLPAALGAWSTWGPNQKWSLRTYGDMSMAELWVIPDKINTTTKHQYGNTFVDRFIMPIKGFTGAGTLSLANAGAGYTNSVTHTFTVTGGTGTLFKGTINSTAGGALDIATLNIHYNGFGYTVGDDLTLVVAGQTPTTAAILNVDALYANDFGSVKGLGTSSGSARSGYKYHLVSEGWVGGATDEQPSITALELLRVSQDASPNNYVEFHPRWESAFGDLLGFKGDVYFLSGEKDGHSNVIKSDAPPIPDAASDHHPIVQLNVNNMPIRSLVGQKFNKDSTIASGPVGSKNGISRLIAQFPRYHEKNGSSSSDKFGPFYYDYFPYSIPLNNATVINLNELDISVSNINGTLASDISDCKILLNITNEENVGGSGEERIANPRERAQTQEQRDVLKSQMVPLKG